jgi:hypothetical protein
VLTRPALVDKPLEQLRVEVRAARELLASERCGRGHNAAEVLLLRRGLLSALEAYVDRLDAEHFPVPYALRDELRLQRGLFS